MGFLSDAYTWIDENLTGGLLPGGHEVTEPGATIAGVIPTPFVGIQPTRPAVPALAGTAAALAAARGMPARGRLQTLVARTLPDGTVIPVSARPGRPALMSTDITAAKRVRRIGRLVNKLFPTRRRSYKSRSGAHAHRSTSKRK